MKEWCILWPKRSAAQPLVITTYLDVERDPIIQQLRDWIASDDRPAPTYPALGVVDLRPVEMVPLALRATDTDVWPMLRRAGLERACAKQMDAYHRSQGTHVAAADAPHDERLRQYRRLVEAGVEELSCRQINEILGWGCANDTALLKAITEVLMQYPNRLGGPITTTALWYNASNGNVVLWRHGLCLWEMRLAVIFVTRLRLGGADVSFLARDIATCSRLQAVKLTA